ncbi:biotin--[acetyl-CoA-carboxylase] ligase [Chitiniphilus purpureus]|uniref:biotin--[biotin carboxyl-carrier protein] ligase n=1 Tax=Chitiniphilus purpureus TaxID=2981137 RepID=A0ABY6DM84_9NEIS|nr:biotin--[acetyl-CoA-carboxylase] ligase [Chitiniphilus sp. CD1]UXY15318.1 biotin--[acetyl-CoA-carboxylase] ligase [Chitiniphilus sp. CD1]
MSHTLACLRFLSADAFTSGAAIAAELALSRASVSAALAEAEQYGVTLERRHGVGYRLAQPIAWLDAQQVRTGFNPGSRLQLDIATRIDSTNRRLLAEPAHGRVLAAEWQDEGRGRLGRRWQARLGGSLLFSLCWQFPGGAATLAGLPLAVGVAVSETLREAGVAGIGLKWPNDLLLATPRGDAKAGGILIEIAGDAIGPVCAVIGIGLNLAAPQQVTDQHAAGLAAHGLAWPRNRLLGRLLGDLETALTTFSADGFAAFRARWEACHAWQGAPVRLLAPDGSARDGIAAGVTDSGALRLQTAQGESIIHSGDLSLRRAAA